AAASTWVPVSTRTRRPSVAKAPMLPKLATNAVPGATSSSPRCPLTGWCSVTEASPRQIRSDSSSAPAAMGPTVGGDPAAGPTAEAGRIGGSGGEVAGAGGRPVLLGGGGAAAVAPVDAGHDQLDERCEPGG